MSNSSYGAHKTLRAINFICNSPQAQSVSLVGDFNRWSPSSHPMKRMPDGAWLLTVELKHGHHRFAFLVDGNLTLGDLRQRFDAVFLGLGLGGTPAMGISGEEWIVDGLAYIEQSKLDPGGMRIGQDVVVIGAGNTAIDCATIAKRLGAARVSMVYRRSEHEMTAYPHELDFIRREGVEFPFDESDAIQEQPTGARLKPRPCVKGGFRNLEAIEGFVHRHALQQYLEQKRS